MPSLRDTDSPGLFDGPRVAQVPAQGYRRGSPRKLLGCSPDSFHSVVHLVCYHNQDMMSPKSTVH